MKPNKKEKIRFFLVKTLVHTNLHIATDEDIQAIKEIIPYMIIVLMRINDKGLLQVSLMMVLIFPFIYSSSR